MRAGALSPLPEDPAPGRLARALRSAAADTVRSVLLYGSRLAGTSPDRFSAYDLVVVVDDYGAFYRGMNAAGFAGRPPGLMAALARVLPPNVMAFQPDPPDGPVAKCMVITAEHLERALSPRAPDHFVKGRLVQAVALVDARDEGEVRWLAERIEGARRRILDWVGPFLDEPFDAAGAARRMIEVSYRGEVRPESGDRALAVFEAQRPFLVSVAEGALEAAEDEGRVVAADGGYRFARPRTRADRRGVRLYFLRSKLRATARWLKYPLTFDNWLDYIARKVERRTGMQVEITPWERRLPYLLLWPKVIRVLRSRPAEMGGGAAGTGAPSAGGASEGAAGSAGMGPGPERGGASTGESRQGARRGETGEGGQSRETGGTGETRGAGQGRPGDRRGVTGETGETRGPGEARETGETPETGEGGQGRENAAPGETADTGSERP